MEAVLSSDFTALVMVSAQAAQAMSGTVRFKVVIVFKRAEGLRFLR